LVARLDARLRGPGSAALIEADELAALERETGLDTHALIRASLEWARRWARPPLSKFEVGAAAWGGSGRLYLGANIEFVGLPLSMTVHAEQSAITHAWVHAETSLQVIATSAAPCGFCRQFMCELPEPRPLLLVGDRDATALDVLLPDAFGPTQLGRTAQLLCAHAELSADADGDDPLLALALAAASRSCAPYTGALAGVAIETTDGQRFVGGVAESAAYNPTLAPMQAALIAVHHGGATLESISRALLIELGEAPLSQHELAAAVLASVAPHAKLERATATRAARARAT
jgi:cytidine deaminase